MATPTNLKSIRFHQRVSNSEFPSSKLLDAKRSRASNAHNSLPRQGGALGAAWPSLATHVPTKRSRANSSHSRAPAPNEAVSFDHKPAFKVTKCDFAGTANTRHNETKPCVSIRTTKRSRADRENRVETAVLSSRPTASATKRSRGRPTNGRVFG